MIVLNIIIYLCVYFVCVANLTLMTEIVIKTILGKRKMKYGRWSRSLRRLFSLLVLVDSAHWPSIRSRISLLVPRPYLFITPFAQPSIQSKDLVPRTPKQWQIATNIYRFIFISVFSVHDFCVSCIIAYQSSIVLLFICILHSFVCLLVRLFTSCLRYYYFSCVFNE